MTIRESRWKHLAKHLLLGIAVADAREQWYISWKCCNKQQMSRSPFIYISLVGMRAIALNSRDSFRLISDRNQQRTMRRTWPKDYSEIIISHDFILQLPFGQIWLFYCVNLQIRPVITWNIAYARIAQLFLSRQSFSSCDTSSHPSWIILFLVIVSSHLSRWFFNAAGADVSYRASLLFGDWWSRRK